MTAGEDVLLLPDDEEAGAAVVPVAEGVEGAPDDESVFAVVVDVDEGFEASPEGGFILSE